MTIPVIAATNIPTTAMTENMLPISSGVMPSRKHMSGMEGPSIENPKP